MRGGVFPGDCALLVGFCSCFGVRGHGDRRDTICSFYLLDFFPRCYGREQHFDEDYLEDLEGRRFRRSPAGETNVYRLLLLILRIMCLRVLARNEKGNGEFLES